MNLCACIGPVGQDPHCPCKMKELGLPCSGDWTPEKIEELFQKFIQLNKEIDKLLVPLNVTPPKIQSIQSINRGLRKLPIQEVQIVDISILKPTEIKL